MGISLEFNQVNDLSLLDKAKIERQARLAEETDLNYSKVEGGSESIGRIALGQDVTPKGPSSQMKREKEAKLHSFLVQLQEHRRWLQEQMTVLEELIDAATLKMEEHSRNIEALKEFIDAKEMEGHGLLDSDGYPADERVRLLVRDYENRTGNKWDADGKEVNDILREIFDNESRSYSETYADREANKNEWDTLNESYQNTEASIEELKAGRYVNESELLALLDVQNTSSLEVSNPPEKPVNELNLDTLPSLFPAP